MPSANPTASNRPNSSMDVMDVDSVFTRDTLVSTTRKDTAFGRSHTLRIKHAVTLLDDGHKTGEQGSVCYT